MPDKRLIAADALCGKEEILYQHTESGKIIPWAAVRVCVINNAPTIDAVEVVRCRECRKRGHDWECPLCWMEWNEETERYVGYFEKYDETEDDGFCHMGAKRDGGAADGN